MVKSSVSSRAKIEANQHKVVDSEAFNMSAGRSSLKENQKVQRKQPHNTPERIVTMKALQEMSDDDGYEDDGDLPPEAEWNKEALALKAAIDSGKFDSVIHRQKDVSNDDDEDGSSFEEVDLDSDSDENEEVSDDSNVEVHNIKAIVRGDEDGNSDEEKEEEDDQDSDDDDEDEKEGEVDVRSKISDNKNDDAGNYGLNGNGVEDKNGTEVNADDNDNEVEEEDDDVDSDESLGLVENNATRSKALEIITATLLAEKRGWSWSETFDVIPPTPLPFTNEGTKNASSAKVGTGNPLGIHDDLQREVAFYDVALEAALEAKVLCHKAGIPFTRPDDFFAEMVKTDEHMAKVKDRLIFEGKKIEAVAQRKSNKEQKLRAKETQANKLAEKAKKKREHMQEVSDWAESARASRGGGENTSIPTNNKKRAYFDQKYGHGGKRGKFKQNDPQSMNDMSSYNKKKGTFVNTPKTKHGSKNGAGANRKGKRARDASHGKSR